MRAQASRIGWSDTTAPAAARYPAELDDLAAALTCGCRKPMPPGHMLC